MMMIIIIIIIIKGIKRKKKKKKKRKVKNGRDREACAENFYFFIFSSLSFFLKSTKIGQ